MQLLCRVLHVKRYCFTVLVLVLAIFWSRWHPWQNLMKTQTRAWSIAIFESRCRI